VTDATNDRSTLNISTEISDSVRRCADGTAGSSVSAKIVGHMVNYAGVVERLGARIGSNSVPIQLPALLYRQVRYESISPLRILQPTSTTRAIQSSADYR